MRKVLLALLFVTSVFAQKRKPNFIIVFTDDQGYQDLGCFGSPNIKTPRIDKMAKEGLMLTSFYAQPVCGPSRAALNTGSYPLRLAQNNNCRDVHPRVHANEITIAEVLQPVGYRSICIGKWDMAGHSQTNYTKELLPTYQGYDEYFGTPNSNDNYVNIIEGDEIIEYKADLSKLTERYTDRAIQFIHENKEQPFFIYLAHTMPHVKLAVSDKFKGKSKGGLYGDVIEELDYHTGRVLDAVEEAGITENTYVVFTSDNGPWWIKKEDAGHCKPLRGAKTATWDGGMRVPFVIKGPGVKAGTVSDLVTATIDIMPTFAKLAGVQLPRDRVLDGVDITDVFHGKTKQLERPFFFYQHTDLRAVRLGKWKLHIPHKNGELSAIGKKWSKMIPANDRVVFNDYHLYNLEKDIEESNNVASTYPSIVAKLKKYIEWARKDIGDGELKGESQRFFEDGHIINLSSM